MADPFLGQVTMFAGNFAPRGWAFCHGQILAINSNTALFSILGTIYGGDGRTTFALPDLRGRTPIGKGNGPGLSDVDLGEKGGSNTTTLNVGNIPVHSHGATAIAKCKGSAGNANTAVGNSWSNDAGVSSATYSTDSPNASMHEDSIEVQVEESGSGNAFNNMQPFLGINYIIALQGIFPSRN